MRLRASMPKSVSFNPNMKRAYAILVLSSLNVRFFDDKSTVKHAVEDYVKAGIVVEVYHWSETSKVYARMEIEK